MQKRSVTWEHKYVYFHPLAYQLKKLLKTQENSECFGGKILIEKWRFWRQETKGRSESPE